MITKLIGLKEFRQNLSMYTSKIKKGEVKYIILKKNVPVLEIRSVDEKEFAMQKLAEEIKEAREQVKSGKVHTQEQIMKEFGLL